MQYKQTQTYLSTVKWTQWHEVKCGSLNLWAAQIIVQLYNATQYNDLTAVLITFHLTHVASSC